MSNPEPTDQVCEFSHMVPKKWIGEFNGQRFVDLTQSAVLDQLPKYLASLKERPPNAAKLSLYREGEDPSTPITGRY